MSKVVGYHGTTRANAEDMARGNFRDVKQRPSKWLGRGLYFFENNFAAAATYAHSAAAKGECEGAVLAAEIDLCTCFDLTVPSWQDRFREAYNLMCAEEPARPVSELSQHPFELHNQMVKAAYSGALKGGNNTMDHAIIEKAISHVKEVCGVELDTVRGIFIEHAPLVRNSWIYQGAHIAIAVIKPELRVQVKEIVPLR